MKVFWAEIQKAHRRHDLPVAVGVALIVVLWASASSPTTADELATGYSGLLYTLPIMNAVVMPVGMAALASRIWDAETKGRTCKLLFTLQSRDSLFAAKAALGMLENLLVCALECLALPMLGAFRGFTESINAGLCVWLVLCTFCVNGMLYFLSFLLSILMENQVAALAVGFCGALIGLFAAFMPRWFSYLVPFGYYVPLSPVGMNWDSDTRIAEFFVRPLCLPLLAGTVILAAALALLCRRAIRNKEV